MFAKRHYEALALVMQEAQTHVRTDAIEQNRCVISLLCELFRQDNPRFNVDCFRYACRPGANVRARKVA